MKLAKRNLRILKSRQPGDIIFFHPETFNPIAHAILLVTKQYYHHGAIVLDRNNIIESDPLKGVHISNIHDYIDSYTLDLFRLSTPANVDQILTNAKALVGWQYDYGNVLWAGLGWAYYWTTGLKWGRHIKDPFDKDKAVDSEEFIDLVFKNSGVDLRLDIPQSNVTAQDLSESRLLVRI